MGLSIENAFKKVESTDSELLALRRKAHETQQDIAGLTQEQVETINLFDSMIREESIITEFDLEQQQTIHPETTYFFPTESE